MKITLQPNSAERTCIDCGRTMPAAFRICTSCGRVAVPLGDHLPAAMAGDEAAQFYLGVQYSAGIDVPRDLAEAEKWFRGSAERGHMPAMQNLGVLCLQRDPPDHAEAAKWLRMAAERGDASAQFGYAVLLFGGLGVPEDTHEAMRLFVLAAEQGNEQASALLSALHDEAERVKKLQGDIETLNAEIEVNNKSHEKLLEWFRIHDLAWPLAGRLNEATGRTTAEIATTVKRQAKEAQRCARDVLAAWDVIEEIERFREADSRGDLDSRRRLEGIVASGLKAARDFDLEIAQCREGAERGNAESQRRLGELLRDGAPMAMDLDRLENWMCEARRWLKEFGDHLGAIREGGSRADEIGQAPAMPRSVEPNAAEAAMWFHAAAVQGDMESRSALGDMYAEGDGVPEDLDEAERWYRLNAGEIKGQVQLALFLLLKHRGTRREAEGVHWLEVAAEQGDAGAQYLLGYVLDQHVAGSDDRARCVHWYRMAAGQDHPQAVLRLAELHRRGESVAKDGDEAARLFRRAFELDAAILVNSGYAYWDRSAQDLAEAIAWFGRFSEEGEQWAKVILDKLVCRASDESGQPSEGLADLDT